MLDGWLHSTSNGDSIGRIEHWRGDGDRRFPQADFSTASLCANQMIREFSLADQTQVVKLQEEFMTEFFPEFANDQRKFEWNADVYAIYDHYYKEGGKAWVIELEDGIVGFGCLRLVDSKTAEIKRVRINYFHRGKGLGKSIINQMESYCSSADISKILVDTDDRFEAAKSMYTEMGYVIYRSETEVKDGHEYTDHYFEKILQRA